MRMKITKRGFPSSSIFGRGGADLWYWRPVIPFLPFASTTKCLYSLTLFWVVVAVDILVPVLVEENKECLISESSWVLELDMGNLTKWFKDIAASILLWALLQPLTSISQNITMKEFLLEMEEFLPLSLILAVDMERQITQMLWDSWTLAKLIQYPLLIFPFFSNENSVFFWGQYFFSSSTFKQTRMEIRNLSASFNSLNIYIYIL